MGKNNHLALIPVKLVNTFGKQGIDLLHGRKVLQHGFVQGHGFLVVPDGGTCLYRLGRIFVQPLESFPDDGREQGKVAALLLALEFGQRQQVVVKIIAENSGQVHLQPLGGGHEGNIGADALRQGKEAALYFVVPGLQ